MLSKRRVKRICRANLQKPTDLDLHCLLRQGMTCFAREGLKEFVEQYGLSLETKRGVNFLPSKQNFTDIGERDALASVTAMSKATENTPDPVPVI